MKQPMNLRQDDLNQIAHRTSDLQTWLDQQETSSTIHKKKPIPLNLTAILSTATILGLQISLDFEIPAGMCWYGNCTL